MQASGNKAWFKQPLVWMLIIIPMSAVIAGIATIIIAVKTDDGLVKDDYYSHGKNINRTIERDKAAAELGLKATLLFDYNNNTVIATISAKPGYTVPDYISTDLLHATRAGNDRMLTLQRTPAGKYFSLIPSLVEGHWIVQLSADNWRMSGHLYIPGKPAVIIDTQATNASD